MVGETGSRGEERRGEGNQVEMIERFHQAIIYQRQAGKGLTDTCDWQCKAMQGNASLGVNNTIPIPFLKVLLNDINAAW